MPCYNLLWGPHVPYLFSLYLGVNRRPIESSRGCSNPDHNEIVEFEGKRYRCKYRKMIGVWFREWELVVDG